MTNRERFLAALNFQQPDDRLPAIEWASWWDQTLDRWQAEGLDTTLPREQLFARLGLDIHHQYWFSCLHQDCPKPASHGAPLIHSREDYLALKPLLYPEHRIDSILAQLRAQAPRQTRGEVVLWFSMDGAFWFPRTLLGIENHFLSFYDEPELYHEIVGDLAAFQLRQMEKIYAICTPDFMTIAEDMSYNLGPMLSEACFDTFLAPYYRAVVPFIQAHGTKVFVDTDGDVSSMLPWLIRVGVEGVLPLERMAGVDLASIRQQHPDLLLMGGFDKMCMKQGEAAMRREFERLLPVMRQGGYIPSVDHQTPPEVSLANYECYVRLLHEYGQKAVKA